MSLHLTILGCDGSYAGADGACTGYLVDDGATRVWVDCGPGTLAHLQRHLPLAELDAVVITHHHPDHWLELPVLRHALRYYLGIEGLPVLAPAETWTVAHALMSELAPTFVERTVADGDDVEVGTLRLRFVRTDHPVETLAVRVDGGGRSMAFTADTGPAVDLGPLGDGIDVLLAEATLDEPADEHVHLSASQAGALATAVGASRLLLTHLPPGTDPTSRRTAAATTFDGPIEAVATHARYDL